MGRGWLGSEWHHQPEKRSTRAGGEKGLSCAAPGCLWCSWRAEARLSVCSQLKVLQMWWPGIPRWCSLWHWLGRKVGSCCTWRHRLETQNWCPAALVLPGKQGAGSWVAFPYVCCFMDNSRYTWVIFSPFPGPRLWRVFVQPALLAPAMVPMSPLTGHFLHLFHWFRVEVIKAEWKSEDAPDNSIFWLMVQQFLMDCHL